MVDRCITMTREMALAALSGHKRQTRRVIPMQEGWPAARSSCVSPHRYGKGEGPSVMFRWQSGARHDVKLSYAIGDTLIVREPYWQWGRWAKIGLQTTPTGKPKMRFEPIGDPIFKQPDTLAPNWEPFKRGWHKRLARFMPASYARQHYKVTDVRVERLQDISEADCLAEGVIEYDGVIDIEPGHHGLGSEVEGIRYYVDGLHDADYMKDCPEDPHDAFRELWDSINSARGAGWPENPWVAVYVFEEIRD